MCVAILRQLAGQMDANWYYAEGDKPVGPLSLHDITAILSHVSDARRVLVWRDGFPNWIEAENVPDLAPYLIKPVAPPVSPSQWLQESKAALTSLAVFAGARASREPSEKKDGDLIGIGGWLILIAIGQVFGLFRFLHFLFGYYAYLDSDLWTQYPITFVGEAAMNMWVVGLMGCATFFLFTKSGLFPAFFVYECVAYILRLPLVIAFKEATVGAYVGHWIPLSLGRRPIAEWMATIILAAISISYIKLSKRVANTFRR
jgi:hypothetical protein